VPVEFLITGGTDHEQQREGDYLSHDERYGRTRECIQIIRRARTVDQTGLDQAGAGAGRPAV